MLSTKMIGGKFSELKYMSFQGERESLQASEHVFRRRCRFFVRSPVPASVKLPSPLSGLIAPSSWAAIVSWKNHPPSASAQESSHQ